MLVAPTSKTYMLMWLMCQQECSLLVYFTLSKMNRLGHRASSLPGVQGCVTCTMILPHWLVPLRSQDPLSIIWIIDLCIPSWRMQAQREAQLDLILSEPSLDATTPAENLKNHSRADGWRPAFQLVFWCVKVISFNVTAGAYASSHSWQNAVACLQADRRM